MEKFDLVVVGTGSAGSITANKFRANGKKVAIIDHQPFGGTCALRGCDPKKVLVQAAELVERAMGMQQKGIKGKAVLSWPELMSFKRTFTDPVPESREKSFRKAGITTYHGTATFISENVIQVGDGQLEAEQFVIAAGAMPNKLNIPGEEFLIDSTGFLDLEQLPQDIVLVGGGYIAMEFAHIAVRAGAKVTIVHRGELPLKNFETDLVKLLLKATRDVGIEVILETEVKSIERTGEHYVVRAKQQNQEITINADIVVHAAGRTPELENLRLENANVTYSKRGVKVNKYLQSVSNPNVYACGDAAEGGLPLTPVAAMEGHVVASNMLKGNKKTPDYRVIPTNVFSIPPMASVGLTEQEARNQGRNVKIKFEETASWFSSKQINEGTSGYKIITDQDSDLIIGAHLLGSHAPEVINILAMAMQHDITASQVRKMIFSYPTSASDLVYMV
ncbi:dihydrolipoyl dehydrogenase family protein [Rufibacter quisquiliarum]|uniref:Glutathione reductase (NADPH) n=1 Tax=Rufibacter quisquiliarum TaxID=1549639 RepID=A0A839GHE5_9BACT|nr:NAD(P)/FAD-dependent oxidoreductase [Rufibacter quisquiliarum]MBA9079084.1 glutathione reductase (NADPH) [Rufibacter quisquiliarum]